MTDQPLTGPLSRIPLPDGTQVPFYVVPFDADGTCTGPRAAADAVAEAAGATDVFLFSHGWNNDWAAATGRYHEFLQAYSALRAQRWNPATRPYRPVLVGVFWPSAVLVGEGEREPDIAADAGLTPELVAAAAAERAALDGLAERLPAADRERFYQLADSPDGLSEEDATELTE